MFLTNQKSSKPIAASFLLMMILMMPDFLFAQETGQAESAGGSVRLGIVSRQVARVTDPQVIEQFLFELFLPEENVTEIQIVDATDNGFGPDDLIVVYPSGHTHAFPEPIPSILLDIMAEWTIPAENKVIGDNVEPEVFRPAPPTEAEIASPRFKSISTLKAREAILYDLLVTLNRNYKDTDLSLRFERGSTGFTFQLWDFKPQALEYVEPPPPVPDSVVSYDALVVLQSDSLIKADTTLHDLLFVYRSMADTVFMPAPPADTTKLHGLPNQPLPMPKRKEND